MAQGADGAVDLFDAGGEGAEVDGGEGVEGGAEFWGCFSLGGRGGGWVVRSGGWGAGLGLGWGGGVGGGAG